MHINSTTTERFWQNVVIGENGNDECWGWTGRVSDGTATIAINGESRGCVAARVSWILAYGDIPDDIPVRHACRNKTCNNPRHLYLPNTEKAFWSRVRIIDDEDSCWEWTGPITVGYGQISVNSRATLTHRYAYELENDSIPDGLFVLHKCDNRLCVRVSHLFLGTNKDNMDDKVAKGRQARWETGGKTKLTWVQVREIRRRVTEGESLTDLGKEYDVTKQAIYNIRENKTWRE